jgi:hypothetical protein
MRVTDTEKKIHHGDTEKKGGHGEEKGEEKREEEKNFFARECAQETSSFFTSPRSPFFSVSPW